MKGLKTLILFEIGLVLVYFDNFKQKLSPRKRFKRIYKGRQGVRLGENCEGHLRFHSKNLKELNELLK